MPAIVSLTAVADAESSDARVASLPNASPTLEAGCSRALRAWFARARSTSSRSFSSGSICSLASVSGGPSSPRSDEEVVGRGDGLSNCFVERLLVERARVGEVGGCVLDLVAPVADARAEVVRPLLRRRVAAAAAGGEQGDRTTESDERSGHTRSQPLICRSPSSLYTRSMPPISFARGIPAPECLPVDELADCARAALERDGRTILSYGPGGGYGPLREWLAERHGVEPSRVVLTNGSLQGFVFLAALLRARTALPRRGADVRPAAEDPPRARRGRRRRAAGRRGARRGRGRGRAGRPGPRSSTRSRPSRTRAAARSRSSAAAASPSSRANTTSCSSRTTRTGSFATRASRCRRSSSWPAART